MRLEARGQRQKVTVGMDEDGFKDLKVWEIAKNLAVRIFRISKDSDLNNDFGLRDQIRRASISIPSNLAEGDERDTDKDSIRFFYIAKGSLAEVRTQLQIAFEVGYIAQDIFKGLDQEYKNLGRKIGALRKARKRIL
jgi:four helix bundle protein